MSSAAASLSICASCAKQLCTAPNPRIAPHGGLLVNTHLLRSEAETRCDLVSINVQPLRRDVHINSALAVGHGQPRFRPEERLILNPDVVDAGNGHVALRVGIAVADHEGADDVRTR